MIEINKKTDIFIPFNKIGDKNWEINTRKIIESIADNYGNELKKGISNDEIEKLENRLGVFLPAELKEFYKKFGIAEIGEELQEFDEIDWIKNKWQPIYSPDFSEEDKKVIPYLITFSNYLGNGNMFCFHSKTKEIYYFDHDSRPFITKMFDNISVYIKCCLIFAQSEFFGEAEQDEVEEWAEDIIAEIIGDELMTKWRY